MDGWRQNVKENKSKTSNWPEIICIYFHRECFDRLHFKLSSHSCVRTRCVSVPNILHYPQNVNLNQVKKMENKHFTSSASFLKPQMLKKYTSEALVCQDIVCREELKVFYIWIHPNRIFDVNGANNPSVTVLVSSLLAPVCLGAVELQTLTQVIHRKPCRWAADVMQKIKFSFVLSDYSFNYNTVMHSFGCAEYKALLPPVVTTALNSESAGHSFFCLVTLEAPHFNFKCQSEKPPRCNPFFSSRIRTDSRQCCTMTWQT